MRALCCLLFALPGVACATAGSAVSTGGCAPFFWGEAEPASIPSGAVVLAFDRTVGLVEELPDRPRAERLARFEAAVLAANGGDRAAWTPEVERLARRAVERLYGSVTGSPAPYAKSPLARAYPVARGRGIELGADGPALVPELPRVPFVPTALADLPAGAFDLVVLNDWPDLSAHALEAAMAATSPGGRLIFGATGPAAAVRLAHVVELSRERGYTFETIGEGAVVLGRAEIVNTGLGTYQ